MVSNRSPRSNAQYCNNINQNKIKEKIAHEELCSYGLAYTGSFRNSSSFGCLGVENYHLYFGIVALFFRAPDPSNQLLSQLTITHWVPELFAVLSCSPCLWSVFWLVSVTRRQVVINFLFMGIDCLWGGIDFILFFFEAVLFHKSGGSIWHKIDITISTIIFQFNI